MLLDLSPLRQNRNFALLFAGQLISAFGSKLSYVAVPYQVYQISKSSLMVGMVSLAQLVPLVVASLLGGMLADAYDRKKLLLLSEGCLAVGVSVLLWNATRPEPSLKLIFVVSGMLAGFVGLHRPVLEAVTTKALRKEEITAASALSSFKTNVTTILGPALAGVLIAQFGLGFTYFLDVLSYLAAMITLVPVEGIGTPANKGTMSLGAFLEGLRYAKSRQELLGTYFIDFIAMVFGMPMALFPALAERHGGAAVLGWYYAAPAVGALLINLFSGWAKHVHRHGLAITWAAALWGVSIIFFGLADNLYVALFFLGCAGAADMVSVMFRFAIWRRTIPEHMRGRLAGLEVVSYATGPLLGDAEAGFMAKATGLRFSVVSGGVLCVLGVFLCAYFLPQFRAYDEREH